MLAGERRSAAPPEVRRMRRASAALALSAVLACLAIAVPARAQKPVAERPSYELGARWLLSDGAYDLIKSGGDGYVFAASPSRQIQLTPELGMARILKDGAVEWQLDPPPKLKWPMEIGKWGVNYNAVLRNRDWPQGIPVNLTW
jgi:hypothetical protein